MGLLGWFWALAAAGSLGTTPPPPLPVVGGQEAEVCEWPSTVALEKFGALYCSGTLIHPRVILTAAHCLHPDGGWGVPESINFGEQALSPTQSAVIETCGIHPFYDSAAVLHSPQDAYDLAYCLLSEPVVGVRPTPMIMGCEVSHLLPGVEVRIAGFGADGFSGDNPSGQGTKRWKPQTLESIDSRDQVFLLGEAGSGCNGDSGGPAYFQLSDGTWRVIAAAARVHPDAPNEAPLCTYGTVYTGAWNEMYWYEAETGLDLTPCHDVDGTWNPGPDCVDFPLDLQAPATWDDGCAAQPTADPSECVEPPTGDTGDSGEGTGDSGDESTTGAALDESGGGGDDSTSGGDASTSDDGSPRPPDPPSWGTGGDAESGSEDAGLEVEDRGCACGSTPAPGGSLLLLPLALGFRRRRSPTCARANGHGS